MIDFERMNLIQPDEDWMLEHGFGRPLFAPGFGPADDGGQYYVDARDRGVAYQVGGPPRSFADLRHIAAIGELDGVLWRLDLRYAAMVCLRGAAVDRSIAVPLWWDELHELWVDYPRWYDLLTDAQAFVRLNAWVESLGFPRSTDDWSPWYGGVG